MSIIIQFKSPFIQSTSVVPSNDPCCSKTSVQLEMVPGVEHTDLPGMTDDENSVIEITTSNSVFATTLKDLRPSQSCFGLPYQDHNYGAPPPPTPPSYSPCPSPALDIAIPDEDTNLSIISTTTTTEEAPEESVTRCICGFEHDDEYMICCDQCLVWQHVDCMGLDRNNIPETYLCEKCEPRKLDKNKAKLLQARKKVTLRELSPTKQESGVNNLVFGKNYKKKTLLQTHEEWHKTDYTGVTPISVTKRFYVTSDSDEDNKSNEHRPKTRSKRREEAKRRKREEEKEEQGFLKRSKSFSKHGRERIDVKRSKLRRNKNKESTSTADEEAQDAWEYSMKYREENFESAINNQYTPEVQQLARTITPEGLEKKVYEQLQKRQCHVLDDGKKKKLVCHYDLPRNTPVIEYKGKFLLASQFHDIHPLYNKRLYPYVLFYKIDQTEISVDASMYGNDARFVRRSCKPNAEIRHMVYNGKLHLYLQSTKVIFSEDEVTVPLNFNQHDSIKEIECACGTEECPFKPKKKNGCIEVNHEKRRRSRRLTASADDESSQSLVNTTQTDKIKASQVKIQTSEVQAHPSESSDLIDLKASSDQETEDNSNECKRKLTREQRKIDAYMRAFTQLEKAEKRKQNKVASERQKAQQTKPEEQIESELIIVKEEEKPPPVPVKEIKSEEEVKVEVKATVPTVKPKKGKRRRGSGTPSRRRTRTNSGGSCLDLCLEEPVQKTTELSPSVPVPTTNTETEIPSQPTCATPNPLVLESPTPAVESPKILKTKRLLLQEWLQEKSESVENANVSSPRSIHTEMKWNISAAAATCYVRCTKDTPHSGGISAAHLRRSNSAGHIKVVGSQGSAKKVFKS
ncbi:hypothetical protein CDAR_486611 [Caerostris darwini]|uniref:SET domain-containing protein n=1 Tax=Caerostris darwini TaxID=1538125 RepID=A0AAV4S9T5_9ARAC|nr:hypothetical protein CDAR_486611 [Caerostris darwini]